MANPLLARSQGLAGHVLEAFQLAEGRRGALEDGRQVAARLTTDEERGDADVERLHLHARCHGEERVGHRAAEAHLLEHQLELLQQRLGRQDDRRLERVSDAGGALQGVGQRDGEAGHLLVDLGAAAGDHHVDDDRRGHDRQGRAEDEGQVAQEDVAGVQRQPDDRLDGGDVAGVGPDEHALELGIELPDVAVPEAVRRAAGVGDGQEEPPEDPEEQEDEPDPFLGRQRIEREPHR